MAFLRKWWLGLLIVGWVIFVWAVGAHADTYIGDSIALGAGRAAHAPSIYARERMGSCWIARDLHYTLDKPLTGWVIVSAGVNDEGRCVRQVRAEIGAQARVIQILPPVKYAQARAAILATGDKFVEFTPGADGLHPRSYEALVRTIEDAERWMR